MIPLPLWVKRLLIPLLLRSVAFNQRIPYYVDGVNGSDRRDGLSPEGALATISKALTLAQAGDTIKIFPGTYIENVVATKDYITLEGAIEARYGWPDIAPASGLAIHSQACQGTVLRRLRCAAPAADTDLVRIEGNGFLVEHCVFDGDAAMGNAKALLRLKGNAADDSFTASEGRIRDSLFRNSGGQGIVFDTGDTPGNGVGSTDVQVTDNIFDRNDQEDIATQDTGGGVYSVQDCHILRNQFRSKAKTTYIDFTTANGGGAGDQSGEINGNTFAHEGFVAGTTVKIVGTACSFAGNFGIVGVIDGSGLD